MARRLNNPNRGDYTQSNQPKGSAYLAEGPQFTNEKERLDWIKHQADQLAIKMLEELRQRLSVVKQR
jgi:hypothetical protein